LYVRALALARAASLAWPALGLGVVVVCERAGGGDNPAARQLEVFDNGHVVPGSPVWRAGSDVRRIGPSVPGRQRAHRPPVCRELKMARRAEVQKDAVHCLLRQRALRQLFAHAVRVCRACASPLQRDRGIGLCVTPAA